MKKLAIPVLLAGVIIVAGVFAFMPAQMATTIHTTILPNATGLACATEAVNFPAAADNQTLTFTFTQPIHITSIELQGAANLNNDFLGFDGVSIDGENALATMGAFEEVLDDDPDLNWANQGPFTISPIYVGSTLALTVDDNDLNAVDANDDVTFVFCGIVEDAGNFDGDDVSSVFAA